MNAKDIVSFIFLMKTDKFNIISKQIWTQLDILRGNNFTLAIGER